MIKVYAFSPYGRSGLCDNQNFGAKKVPQGFINPIKNKLPNAKSSIGNLTQSLTDAINKNAYKSGLSNEEWLRSRTKEELVEWFDSMISSCDCNNFPCRQFCDDEPTCSKAWLKWLKQEAT